MVGINGKFPGKVEPWQRRCESKVIVQGLPRLQMLHMMIKTTTSERYSDRTPKFLDPVVYCLYSETCY